MKSMDPLGDAPGLTPEEKLDAIMAEHFAEYPAEQKADIRESLWKLHLLYNSKPKVN